MRKWKPREIGFVLFLAALVLRVAYSLCSAANPLLSHPILDESYYIDLGRRIAGGFWPGEGRVFFMDPLYGYLLGLVFAVFGEGLETVRILQMALDSLNAVLIFYLGRRLWSPTAGLVAGILYAVYKVSFFYALLFLKTTVTVTSLLLFTILLLDVLQRGRAARWLLLGACCALLVYLQANLLTLVPLTLALYWVLQRPGRHALLKHSVCFLGGVAIFLAPGALRNHYVSGEWIWLNTQSGRLLYSSNNPDNLTGRYNVPPFARPHPEDSELDFQKEAERRAGKRLSAAESSRYWTGETWSFLKSHPREVLTLLKGKGLGSVTNQEIPVDHSFELNERLAGTDRWPLPTFALVFGLGIPGLAAGLARRRETAVLLLPIATVLATILLFYTSSRFRMPAVPFLILGAGIGVDRVVRWWQARRMGAALVFALAAVALFTISICGIRVTPSGTEEFYLAKAYWAQGNPQEAARVASEAVQRFPGQARFPALLAMAALSEGRFDEAIRLNREAIRLDPSYADAWHNLGLALLLSGRGREAVEPVEKAIALSSNSRYFFTLAKAHEAAANPSEALRSYEEFLRRSKPTDPYRKDAEERVSVLQPSRGRP